MRLSEVPDDQAAPSPDPAPAPAAPGGKMRLSEIAGPADQPAESTSQQRADKDASDLLSQPGRGAESTLFKSATFGLGDQITAGAAAARTGITNVAGSLVGREAPYSAGEMYDATRKAQRSAEEGFSKAHPYAAAGTEIAGGFLTPGGKEIGEGIAAGKTAMDRVRRAAAVGAGIGAVGGAANTDGGIEDRLWGAVNGARSGFEAGGAAQGLGSVAKAAAPRIKAALSEAWAQGVKAYSGQADAAILTPEQHEKAFQFAVDHVKKMIASTGMTLPDLMKNEAFLAGKPITSAEAIGRPAISQLMSIGRRQGSTPDQLESMLRQRLTETPERVLATLGKQAGVEPNAVQGNFDTMVRDLRKANEPLYQIAYDGGQVQSEKLTELLNRPSVKKALAGAREIAAEEGRNPDDIGLIKVTKPGQAVVDPATGKPVWGAGPDTEEEIQVKNPTIQTWDYVKRALGDVVYRDRDELGRPNLDTKGRAVRDTLSEMRNELFDLSPAYAKAVAAGGEPIRLQEVFDATPKLMRGTTSEDQFMKIIAKDTPAELAARKGSWVNSVYTQAQNGKLKLNDMTSPAFVRKTRALLGDDQADKFITDVRLEQELTRNAQRMIPGSNSVTFELQSAEREVNEALHNVGKSVKAAASGNLFSAAGHILGGGVHGQRTPFSEGERNEIGRLMMLPPDQLKAQLDAAAAHMNVGASPADDIINKILGRTAVAGANLVNQ